MSSVGHGFSGDLSGLSMRSGLLRSGLLRSGPFAKACDSEGAAVHASKRSKSSKVSDTYSSVEGVL